MMNLRVFRLLLFWLCGITSGCDMQDNWLDVKRNINDVMPSTLSDYQALLDNNFVINESYSMLGMMSSDNFYVSDDIVPSLTAVDRNAYLFAEEIFEGMNHGDFFNPYIKVAYANIILQGLNSRNDQNSESRHIRGQALFVRALNFYYLSQIYSKPYNRETADTDLGIQLRKTTDPGETTSRATVRETYEQITSDLEEAATLLPDLPLYRTRASKASAWGLLAKVYLILGEYEKAGSFAKNVLDLSAELLDFNSEIIDKASLYSFPPYSNADRNPEILFYVRNLGYSVLRPGTSIHTVDSTFYNSYNDHDLRKELFFETELMDRVRFVGGYTGGNFNFGGIATNEILLIKAECLARSSEWREGVEVLNHLLLHRHRSGEFVPLEPGSQDEALSVILAERRKELPFTGLVRWEDLRRLSNDPKFAKTVTRIYLGQRYELVPGSPRYAFPFPDQEIQLSSIPQNIR